MKTFYYAKHVKHKYISVISILLLAVERMNINHFGEIGIMVKSLTIDARFERP